MPDITTRADGPGAPALVVVEGEIVDPPDGQQLYDAICTVVKQRARAVHVDLAAVPYLGSTGINALIQACNDARRLDCLVTVVAVSPLVKEVLEVADLTDLLGLDPGES